MRAPCFTSVVASALIGCSASPSAPEAPVPSASASASAAPQAPSASFESCTSLAGADRAKCELDTCKGEAAACQTRAASLPAEDGAHAIALYEEACEANEMLACATLGGALLTGKPPVEKDLGRGFALVQRACEGDVMEACTMTGTAYEAGLKQGGFSLPRDLEKAKSLYTKACDRKIAEACAALGTFYLGEKGTPRTSSARPSSWTMPVRSAPGARATQSPWSAWTSPSYERRATSRPTGRWSSGFEGAAT
ncbi:MAG: sel1 repeat family protein [Myxococcales bacterium]|nr:sel1 repeat family protein [Myxococcales bacterium]